MTKDLTGCRFGRWTVVKRGDHVPPRGYKWHCLCDCGNAKQVLASVLLSGGSKSCRCLANELAKQRLTTHGATVGRVQSPTFLTWAGMRNRCNNPQYSEYHLYGGKGIKVCPRWDSSFEAFLEDMGERPEGHSLDRKKGELGYFKDNCRWATPEQQGQNTSKTVLTVELVREIKRLRREENLGARKIAARMNLPIHLTDSVVYGRTWRNIS